MWLDSSRNERPSATEEKKTNSTDNAREAFPGRAAQNNHRPAAVPPTPVTPDYSAYSPPPRGCSTDPRHPGLFCPLPATLRLFHRPHPDYSAHSPPPRGCSTHPPSPRIIPPTPRHPAAVPPTPVTPDYSAYSPPPRGCSTDPRHPGLFCPLPHPAALLPTPTDPAERGAAHSDTLRVCSSLRAPQGPVFPGSGSSSVRIGRRGLPHPEGAHWHPFRPGYRNCPERGKGVMHMMCRQIHCTSPFPTTSRALDSLVPLAVCSTKVFLQVLLPRAVAVEPDPLPLYPPLTRFCQPIRYSVTNCSRVTFERISRSRLKKHSASDVGCSPTHFFIEGEKKKSFFFFHL